MNIGMSRSKTTPSTTKVHREAPDGSASHDVEFHAKAGKGFSVIGKLRERPPQQHEMTVKPSEETSCLLPTEPSKNTADVSDSPQCILLVREMQLYLRSVNQRRAYTSIIHVSETNELSTTRPLG